jgi:hypothetical protein
VNIIHAETVKSVGIRPEGVKEPTYNGYYAIYNIHSEHKGTFDELVIDETLEKHIVEKEIRVKRGDTISSFTGANASMGTLFLRFDSHDEMIEVLNTISKKISTEPKTSLLPFLTRMQRGRFFMKFTGNIHGELYIVLPCFPRYIQRSCRCTWTSSCRLNQASDTLKAPSSKWRGWRSGHCPPDF